MHAHGIASMVPAPTVAWYDRDFIEQHPEWLFVYAATHSEDSERVLRADGDAGASWLPQPADNLWGERPVGYRNGGNTTRNQLRHPLGERLLSIFESC